MCSWRIGASFSMAASTVVTEGSTSYSTSIKDKSSSASCMSDAAIAAIGWPLNNTLSEAKILSLTYFIFA